MEVMGISNNSWVIHVAHDRAPLFDKLRTITLSAFDSNFGFVQNINRQPDNSLS